MFTLKLQNIFLCERLISAGGVEGSEAEQAGEPSPEPLLFSHTSHFFSKSRAVCEM